MGNSKYITWQKIKKELLKDSEVKMEYDRLDPEYKLIGQIIKKRIEKGISQKQMAKKMNTKQSALSRLESGNYNPTLKFLNKVAKALDSKLVIGFK